MSSSVEHRDPGRRDRRFLLIPALTFLIGLVLGGLLVWVGFEAAEEGAPEGDVAADEGQQGETPVAGDTGPTDTTITVPGECLEAAEHAQQMLDLARRAAEAIGQLDAQRLRALVEEMEELEPQIRGSAGTCQEIAG